MTKPNFIIIGAQKAGTTWLYENLIRHPEIYLPPAPNKELYYFSWKYDKGLAWYLKFFEGVEDEIAIGEATPNYTADTHSSEVAERIFREVPDAKLIYMARSPLPRMESGYLQLLENAVEVPGDFNTAVRQVSTLVEGSRYWARLSDYRKHFADEKIHCIFLEDVSADPAAVLRNCCEFLGVDPEWNDWPPRKKVNRREDKSVHVIRLPQWVRNSAAFEKVRNATPRGLVRAVDAVRKRKIQVSLEWDEATKAWAIDQLGDDPARFLEYCQKPPDFWSA